jgi:sterol desaturase/sphingolipid hydroxylase (fatty acid hydroxylase superfamily)
MKKLFNSPEMHIWHHAYELPKGREYGMNFGITLAVWDYLFGTADIPHDGRDIRLGFPGDDAFPADFAGQAAYGLGKDH